MIKKLFFIVFVVTFGFITFFLSQSNKIVAPKTDIITTEKQSEKEETSIYSYQEFAQNGTIYRYAFTKIDGDVTLIPNFDSRLTSGEIVERHGCDYGINGGFYTKENMPLGLFYTNNAFFGQEIESSTFHSFLAKKFANNNLEILASVASENVEKSFEFVFQTGPRFDLNSEYSLSFADKQYARRSLLAKDYNNNFYFFSIFEKESRFSGPRLEDIPSIFKSEELQTIANFIEVLNLDGGSASAFYDKSTNTRIGEITPIGSFLCGVK